MLPHGRTALFHPPKQLPDQACAHGCAPILDGVAARYTSLDPTTTSLETFTRNMGAKLGRQTWRSWMSSSHYDQGGDLAFKSLGSEPPLLEQLALGEGKATELGLLASHMIHNINEHVKKKTGNSQLRRKGIKQEDPRGELDNQLAQTKQTTKEEKQLDQARLLEGQLRHDLRKKKLQLMELQQKDRKITNNNNSLGTSNLGTINNNDLGANSLEEQTLGDKNLGCEKPTIQQELRARASSFKNLH